MKVKTESGFSIEFDEEKMKDWEFAKALARCETPETAIQGITFVVPFLFGEEGEKQMVEYLKKEKGAAKTQDVIVLFREIMEQVKKEQKK